jgi:putative membrane protein
MRFLIIITALASLAPWAVFPTSAQFGNPGGLDPATRESAPGVPAPGQTNIPDRLFTTLAAQGGIAEVELGKLAQQKSRNEMVTAFAQQMIDDHGKSNTQLAQLAKEVGLSLPSEPAPDQLQTRQELSMLSQGQFEAEYMRVQVTEHQKTVQLLLWVIASGEHSDLHHFASDALPTVLHHLQRAQNLVSQLTGAVTP